MLMAALSDSCREERGSSYFESATGEVRTVEGEFVSSGLEEKVATCYPGRLRLSTHVTRIRGPSMKGARAGSMCSLESETLLPTCTPHRGD